MFTCILRSFAWLFIIWTDLWIVYTVIVVPNPIVEVYYGNSLVISGNFLLVRHCNVLRLECANLFRNAGGISPRPKLFEKGEGKAKCDISVTAIDLIYTNTDCKTGEQDRLVGPMYVDSHPLTANSGTDRAL